MAGITGVISYGISTLIEFAVVGVRVFWFIRSLPIVDYLSGHYGR